MVSMDMANIAPKNKQKIFFLSSLFFISIATVILYSLFSEHLLVKENQDTFIFFALTWVGTAHVATTAFFYADKEFIPHVRSRPVRYIYAPLAALVICIIIWGATYKSVGFWFPWQIYHGWLLWHFMRQNIGISALAAKASNESRLTDLERQTITATSVAAILGAMHFGPPGPLSLSQEKMIANVGWIIFVMSTATMVYCIYLRLKTNIAAWVTPAFLAAMTVFFAPTFLFNSYIGAVMGYATAHALQYWFLMSMIAVGSGRTVGYLRSIGSLLGFAISIWGIIYLSRQEELWQGYVGAAVGLGIGITISHFIIDADAWRLREKFQRDYIMSRLSPFMGGS